MVTGIKKKKGKCAAQCVYYPPFLSLSPGLTRKFEWRSKDDERGLTFDDTKRSVVIKVGACAGGKGLSPGQILLLDGGLLRKRGKRALFLE